MQVVPPNDPAALAASVCELIALGAEGRERLGMNARKRVADMFNETAEKVPFHTAIG